MKQSLGKVMLMVLALSGPVWGVTYQWSILQAPQSLRVGEAGIIRYECAFSTSAGEYTIDFKPQGNDEYAAEILTQRDRVISGKRIETFDVRVTPKKEGKLAVALNALVRHTTFASIENATIGRDNVRRYDFNDEKIALPVATIEAKSNSADLTGTVTLEAHADKTMVRAHEPVHLSVYIRGSGNLERFVPYELNISGVTIFAEEAQKNLNPSPMGWEGEIRQEFALVAEHDFLIPSLRLSVFDTGARTMKLLKTAPIAVEVGEGYEPQMLLDPPDLGDKTQLKRYALYGGLVLLGMILGELLRRLWRIRPRRREKHFWDGVSDPKELALILALTGKAEYEPIIGGLESGTLGLREAKNKLSTLTSDKRGRR